MFGYYLKLFLTKQLTCGQHEIGSAFSSLT